MGQTLASGLSALGRFSIAALVDTREPAELVGANYASSWDDVDASTIDVVVDFSSPEGVVASATWCAAHGKGLVIGTTGLSSDQRHVVDDAATKVGVVIAANYSLGAVLSEKFAGLAPSPCASARLYGSTLATPVFSATAGTALNFYF